MFSGKRTTVADHQVCRFLYKLAEPPHTIRSLKIKTDSQMYARMPEMPVHHCFISMSIEQFAQIAQIATQLFRRDARIFPTLPSSGLARNMRHNSQAGLAYMPRTFDLNRISQ